jgi:hypothetical protein
MGKRRSRCPCTPHARKMAGIVSIATTSAAHVVLSRNSRMPHVPSFRLSKRYWV